MLSGASPFRKRDPETGGGCLLINSVLEIGSRDAKLGPQIACYIGEIEDFSIGQSAQGRRMARSLRV